MWHDLSVDAFVGQTVLDLGCGKSLLGTELAEAGVAATVIGLDISRQQLEFRSKWAEENDYSVQADLGAGLPIRSASVDIVLATFSFPAWAAYPEQVRTFYKECGRVLKAGGLLSITPNNVAPMFDAKEPERLTTNTDKAHRACKQEAASLRSSPNWYRTNPAKQLVQAIKAV